jgi:hypothetical protein
MKRFYVYHNPNFLDKVVCGGIGLELVAAVMGENIEDAFRDTNNIDCGWWENDNVIPMFEGNGCRSTSMYDVVIDDDVAYVCMACGWERHDHLTKWWNKLKKEKVTKAVDNKFLALTIFGKNFQPVEVVTEEEFYACISDDVVPPYKFTFDDIVRMKEEDMPF